MADSTIVINGTTYQFISNSNYAGYSIPSTGPFSNYYLEGGQGTSQGAKGSGALLRISGGKTVSNVIVNQAASVNVSGTSTLINPTVDSGAFIQGFAGAQIQGGEVKDGGILSIQAGSTVSGVTFDSGSTLTLHVNSKNFTASTITNLNIQQGTIIDVIDDAGQPLSLSAEIKTVNGQKVLYIDTNKSSSSDHQIVITLDKNSTFSDQSDFHTFNKADPFSQPYATSYQELVVCFLAGAEIATPNGTSLVENIKIGDEVTVFNAGKPVTDTVTWAGEATCTIRANLTDDEAGYPVRILQDAIAQGVPSQDLLLTADHCLFFDGKFIPARMLVNGRSVFFDKNFTSYSYYHIETARHSVIMANNVLTESYLDTGNRSAFRHQNLAFVGHKAKSWDVDAAAPLSTTPEVVKPIFTAIEERAIANNIASQTPSPRLTQDANITLVTNTGLTLNKLRETNGHMIFMLPGDVQSVRIMSRASRPCDIVGAFWDDRRSIGVGVGNISIFEWNQRTPITTHHDVAELDGWNNLETVSDKRWTTGNAFLPLNREISEEQALLSLEIQTVDYILEDAVTTSARLKA
nr:Hint domain-containing protein [uncultured Neokomagataea sp.]